MNPERPVQEKPVPLVRGTTARESSEDFRSRRLSEQLLETFGFAGYDRIRTPDLDLVELHERKSGAAITTRIVELTEFGDQGPICLRPELTVGVVRSLIDSGRLSVGAVRVGVAGSVYRRNEVGGGGLQEIEQVGAELLGDPSVEADAEVIALAVESLTRLGVGPLSIRIGDVGLILEAVTTAGLPTETRKAIVEAMADAAADGRGLAHVEEALKHWGDWLNDQVWTGRTAHQSELTAHHELHRLFHHLVGNVSGRRTESEILDRLKQKWHLAESLPESLRKAAHLVHEMGSLSGLAKDVLKTLETHPVGTLAANSRQRLGRLSELLNQRFAIDSDRIRIDLGVARGIGFYSGLVFSLHADKAGGLELGGGGRYDGLASVLGMSDGDDYGVGFAIGIDRVNRCFGSHEWADPVTSSFVIHPSSDTEQAYSQALQLVIRVRNGGGRCRLATPNDIAKPDDSIRIDLSDDGRPTCTDTVALERFLGHMMSTS